MQLHRSLVGEAGLEPARPEWTLEPESSESANSTTRPCADCSDNIAHQNGIVNHFFKILQNFFKIPRHGVFSEAQSWAVVRAQTQYDNHFSDGGAWGGYMSSFLR